MILWYVKDLSKLTGVSIQTLHHYDRIDLLKPSVRMENGYRVYSEKDLLKLQQIIALKFFGFELSQIKMLLAANIDMIDHFSAQSQFLEDKAKSLLDASNALKGIISDCHRNKSIPWETIIKLIEVYRMTQELQQTWAGKVFNAAELKEYANFQQEIKTRFTDAEIKSLENEWDALVDQVNNNLSKGPFSEFGISLGKRAMEWVNKYYGPKYAGVRNTIWNKGFKNGEIDDSTMSPESFAWLDKAIEAHYRSCIYRILAQVDTHHHDEALKSWKALLVDMYGNDQTSKNGLYEAAMEDSNVSQSAKNWLKKVTK